MKRTGTVMAALTLSLAAVPVFAQQPPIRLTLKEAVKLAFERNLDLRVELYNPAIAEAEIRRSLGIYDPVVTAGAEYLRNTTPNTFNFTPIKLDQARGDAALTQLLPTGGTIAATAQEGYTADSVNYFSSGLNLSLSQPLLRNFGRETTELTINVSRYNKEGAFDRFKTKLSDTVLQVRNQYFQLYNLREALKVRQSALTLAQKILAETKGRVAAGVLPAMEILNAEFGVSTREKDLIDAQRALKDQMDLIRNTLQLESNDDIDVVDEPTRAEYVVNPDQALALALEGRPEIAAQRVAIKINDLQERVAKNRTLPDLSINANVGTIGFSKSYTKSWKNTLGADDPVWGVGVNFSYPLGNRAAENEYIRSKLVTEQSQTQLQSLQSSITTDVNSAVRLVGTTYKQLDVTSRGRAYAEERLRAFQKKNAVGLATTKDVIDVLNDVVAAEGAQIQAVVDYNNAITQLWRVTGEILDRQGIVVGEEQGDPLYRKAR